MKQGGDEGDAWTSVDERKSGKYSDNELQNTNIVYYKVRDKSFFKSIENMEGTRRE